MELGNGPMKRIKKSPRTLSLSFVKNACKKVAASVVAITATCAIGYPSIYAQIQVDAHQLIYPSNTIPVVSQNYDNVLDGCGACAQRPFAQPQIQGSTQPFIPPSLQSYNGTPVHYPIQPYLLSDPTILPMVEYSNPIPIVEYPSSPYPQSTINGEVILNAPIQVTDGAFTPSIEGNAIPSVVQTSPSDLPHYPATNNSESNALKERLELSEVEVSKLKTVVAELKVDLKAANDRVYATEIKMKSFQDKTKELADRLVKSQLDTAEIKKEATLKVDRLQKSLLDMDKKLADRTRTNISLKKELDDTRQRLDSMSKDRDRLANMAQNKLADRSKFMKEIQAAEAELAQQKSQLAKMLNERDRLTKMLLDARKEAEAARRNADQALATAKEMAEKNKIGSTKKADAHSPTHSDAEKRLSALMKSAKKAEGNSGSKTRKRRSKKKGKSGESNDQPETPKKQKHEVEIDKLTKSMERQIKKAETDINAKLKKQLKTLAEEGYAKNHPITIKAVKSAKEQLEKRVEGIRKRVKDRINRIRQEIRRRQQS